MAICLGQRNSGSPCAATSLQPDWHHRDFGNRLPAFNRQETDQSARRGGCFRAAGAYGVPGDRDQWRCGGDPDNVRWCLGAAVLCQCGYGVPVRCRQPAGEHVCAGRFAGDRVLRRVGVDTLFPWRDAADRALGRRRDWLGHRRVQSGIAGCSVKHFRRPVGKPAGGAPLSRSTAQGTALHADDRWHGWCRRHNLGRLCRAAG